MLTTRNRAVVKRTMAGPPIYSFVLGLIALFGAMAIAGHIAPLTGANGKPNTNTVVPNLFQTLFPHWFTGLAFAMIVIGALVPAAFMSIAAANLFTRDIYKEYLRRDASPLNTDVGIYIGFIGVVINLVVCVAGTVLLRALRAKEGVDQTAAADYFTHVAEQPQAEPVVTAGGLA